MKIYFVETSDYNEIAFTEGNRVKITESAPSGKFEGVDLYGSGAIEALKALFSDLEARGELNAFNEIKGEETTAESLNGCKLTLIHE